MASVATVGVHDDLATGQAGVALGAAYYEAAGGINEEFGLLIQQGCGDHRANDLLNHIGADGLQGDRVAVLCGNDHGIHASRLIVNVFYGDLSLAIRAQIGESAILTQIGQLFAQGVGQSDRQRHQLGGLVAGITEHNALVAGTDLVIGILGTGAALNSVVDTHGDVGGLLIDSGHHRTGGIVKISLFAVIADIFDHAASNRGNIHDRGGGDLAHDHHHAGGAGSLAGYVGVRILREDRVQHGVGNLITDLVGMAFGYGLRRKEKLVHIYTSLKLQ